MVVTATWNDEVYVLAVGKVWSAVFALGRTSSVKLGTVPPSVVSPPSWAAATEGAAANSATAAEAVMEVRSFVKTRMKVVALHPDQTKSVR